MTGPPDAGVHDGLHPTGLSLAKQLSNQPTSPRYEGKPRLRRATRTSASLRNTAHRSPRRQLEFHSAASPRHHHRRAAPHTPHRSHQPATGSLGHQTAPGRRGPTATLCAQACGQARISCRYWPSRQPRARLTVASLMTFGSGKEPSPGSALEGPGPRRPDTHDPGQYAPRSALPGNRIRRVQTRRSGAAAVKNPVTLCDWRWFAPVRE